MAVLTPGRQPAYLCLISEPINPITCKYDLQMQPSLHPQECIYPSDRTANTAEKQSLKKPKTQRRSCAHLQMRYWWKKCNWPATIRAGEDVERGVDEERTFALCCKRLLPRHAMPGCPFQVLSALGRCRLVGVPL